jgi:hypothetical protein
VCAQRRAHVRAAELERLMDADRDGRWQMLTLTLEHRQGESLRGVFDRLMLAWRSVRSHRSVRGIIAERVTASIRATEVTWGQNGWHPHIHLLWRTSEWTPAERRELEALWCARAGALPGVAIRWSSPITASSSKRARYLGRLGCEVSGLGKRPHAGHFSPWQIGERAAEARANAALDTRWLFLWREYQSSMKGRRVLELDERARAMVPDAEASHVLAERRVQVYGEIYEAIARQHWWLPLSVLEASIGGTIDDAARGVSDAIADLCDGLALSPVHRARAPPSQESPRKTA